MTAPSLPQASSTSSSRFLRSRRMSRPGASAISFAIFPLMQPATQGLYGVTRHVAGTDAPHRGIFNTVPLLEYTPELMEIIRNETEVRYLRATSNQSNDNLLDIRSSGDRSFLGKTPRPSSRTMSNPSSPASFRTAAHRQRHTPHRGHRLCYP